MSAERKTPHCALLLELLSDGAWHTHLEIYALQIIGHSRVAELCGPRYGYSIERKRRKIGSGETEYLYRLVGVAAEPAPPLVPVLEGRLSDAAHARLQTLFRSEATPPPVWLEDGEEQQNSGTPRGQSDVQQLELDEIICVENEISAIRSFGDLTTDELERLDVLEARHRDLDVARSVS